MGLQELQKEITGQADAEAAKTIATAQREATRIRDEHTKRTEAHVQAASVKTDRLLEQIKKRELAAVMLETKKAALVTKREIMDSLFEEAKERLTSMSSTDRKALLQPLVKRATKEINVAKILCNEQDRKLITQKTAPLEICGGIIAEDKSGRLRVDYSFETLLEEIREKHLEEIAKPLL